MIPEAGPNSKKTMRKNLLLTAALCALCLSCTKQEGSVQSRQESVRDHYGRIAFIAEGIGIVVDTRVDVVSSLSAFNVIATKGAAGSETDFWGEQERAVKEGTAFVTDRWWPATDEGLSFYASNASLTFGAAGTTVTVDGTTDVVCAYSPTPTAGEDAPMPFGHILARVQEMSVSAADSDYIIDTVNVTIEGVPQSGTYNLRTGAWSSLGSSADIRVPLEGEGGADVWLIPGTYDIEVFYGIRPTVLDSIAPVRYFVQRGSVTLTAGRRFSLDTEVDYIYVSTHAFTLGGNTLYPTLSNLLYDAEVWHLEDFPWSMLGDNQYKNGIIFNHEQSVVDLYGWATSGYLTNDPWETLSSSLFTYGPGITSGEWTSRNVRWDWGVNNTIYGHREGPDGQPYVALNDAGGEGLSLRVLTKDEWDDLFNFRRMTGGMSTASTYAEVNGVPGMVVFSDDYEPSGPGRYTIPDGGSWYVSPESWARMEQAGAVFLPFTGVRERTTVSLVGEEAYYWSSTATGLTTAYARHMTDSGGNISESVARSTGSAVRLFGE